MVLHCSAAHAPTERGGFRLALHLRTSQPSDAKPHCSGFCCTCCEDRVSPDSPRTVFEPCYELILLSLEGKLDTLRCHRTQMINLGYPPLFAN